MPWAIANASYKQQEDNDGVTQIVEIKDRGQALDIDNVGERSPTLPSPSSSVSVQ